MNEPAALAVREIPFRFTGDAREYFAIWIVNLALTVLTLGVFSAWAKVRRERYFYGNTWVDDVPFEYLAPPLAILRGRLIAVSALILYVVLSETLPLGSIALLAVLFIATPWILVNGLRFRARYSAWRSLTFHFDGRVGDAYVPYFWLVFFVPVTLGLAFPYIRYRQRRFMVDNHRFADERFALSATVGDFIFVYIIAAFLALGTMVVAVGIGVGVYATGGMELALPTGVLLFYGALFSVWVYVVVQTTNLVFNTSRLGAHTFKSTLQTSHMLWIYVSNTVAVLATVGLLIPWAQIRLARYRASRMTLLAIGGLDTYAGRTAADQTATGAEAAELFDVDLSL